MLANRFMTLPEPFESVVREMDRRFGDLGVHNPSAVLRQAPVALWEDEDKISIEVEVPGIRQEDLDVRVQDGMLIINGQRKRAEKTGKCWYNEQSYGEFERMIALSDVVETDSVDAQLSDGILSVSLHKKPEAKPHRILIGSRGQGGQTRIGTAPETPEPSDRS